MQKIRRTREQYREHARTNPQFAKRCQTPLGEFPSATAAAKAHGCSVALISRYCKGEYLDWETDIVWKYLDG